jgi:DNA-binding MarR family transcriptional regulator
MMSERLTTSASVARSPVAPPAGANLGYLFRLAHQRFRALLDEQLDDLGVTAQEYGILSVFQTRPEQSTSELARISQVTRQTMHASIVALEAAGLLERRAQNQRVVLVRPTARGRRRLQAATARVRRAERMALAGLDREQQRTVRAWLAGLAALESQPNGAARRPGDAS